MLVGFQNNYPSPVWVASMHYDTSSCAEYGDWATEGWWRLGEGDSANCFWTTNRYAAFYAEAEDGAYWAGPYGPAYVYWHAFESCVDIGSTAAFETVGMRLIDLGDEAWVPVTYTLNLIP